MLFLYYCMGSEAQLGINQAKQHVIMQPITQQDPA